MLSCHFFFFKIFHTKPQLSRPYLVENVSSVKTTLFYGPKKSIRCPFFFNRCSLAHVLSEIRLLSIRTLLSRPYFVKKRPFFKKKKLCSHSIFLKFLMKTPLLPIPYLIQKPSILSKLHYIMGPQSQ